MSIEKALTKLSKTNQELANRLSGTVVEGKILPKKPKTLNKYLRAIKGCGIDGVKVLSCDPENVEKSADYVSWIVQAQLPDSATLKSLYNLVRKLTSINSKISAEWTKDFHSVLFNDEAKITVLSYLDTKYHFSFTVLENKKDYEG